MKTTRTGWVIGTVCGLIGLALGVGAAWFGSSGNPGAHLPQRGWGNGLLFGGIGLLVGLLFAVLGAVAGLGRSRHPVDPPERPGPRS